MTLTGLKTLWHRLHCARFKGRRTAARFLVASTKRPQQAWTPSTRTRRPLGLIIHGRAAPLASCITHTLPSLLYYLLQIVFLESRVRAAKRTLLLADCSNNDLLRDRWF